MAVIGDATIEVHADTDGFGKQVNSKFGAIAKSAAGIFASAFAAAKAFDFVGDSLAEAKEAAQVARLTEAVVKSTRGAANVSAEALGNLAERLSNIAAVDDEVIQSAGNVLLTFTKVRNEVGAGNNIFDRATEAALNMSAALKTDLQGSVLQLGKALNDPIKGMTALSRAGVSFTQQQKDQVKALVAAGKTLEAQKIILAEMEVQFGGAAAAAADPTARLGVVIGNLKERIGTALLPVVERAATWLSNNLPAALDIAARFFHRARDAIAPLIGAARELWSIFVERDFTGVGPWAEDSAIVDKLFRIRDALAEWVAIFRKHVLPVIQDVVGWVRDHLTVVLTALAAVIIGMVGGPFAVLGAGLVAAYQRFEGFRNVVDTVARFLTDTVAPAVAKFAGYVQEQFGKAVAWVQQYWPQISEAVGHVMRAVRTVVETVGGAIAAFWRAWGDDLLRIVETVWGYIRRTIENVVGVIQGVIRTVLAVINGDWGKAWDGIKQVVASVWDQIKNVVGTALGIVKSVIGGAVSSIQEVWRGGWDTIKGVVSDAWNRITSAVSSGKDRVLETVRGLPGTIADAFSGLATTFYNIGKDLIGSLWDGIYDQTIGRLKSGLQWVTDKIPDWKGPLSKDRQLLRATGQAIMQGLLDGIRSSTGDVRTYLQAFTANIVTQVQGALGAIRAAGSLESAQRSLRAAERLVNDLASRQARLPALVRQAEDELARATAEAAAVTPSERLRIDRARQAVIDKTAELNKVRSDAASTTLDVDIATGELRVAEEELAAAIRDSTGTTDAMTAAADRLNQLRQEQRDVADQLADAERAVEDAQLGVVDATLSLTSAQANLSSDRSLVGWLRDIAREAGLSEEAIRRMIDAIDSTPSGGTKPPGGTGGGPPVGGYTPPGMAPKDATRQDLENIARFVGETWSPGKIDRILQQINEDRTRTIESVIADVDRRINGSDAKAVVNFNSIDTKGLLERMEIKAAVGQAVSDKSRLRPVG